VTKAQMLAECKRLAPDFRIAITNGRIWATCTINGEPLEMGVVQTGAIKDLEAFVLRGCLESIRLHIERSRH